MIPSRFFSQLAIERCRQSLAQLSALHYVDSDEMSEKRRTVQILLENIDRDLSLVQVDEEPAPIVNLSSETQQA